MKYSTEERVALALCRGRALAKRRERRTDRCLSGLAAGLLAALVLVICTLPPGNALSSPDSVYGALLLSAEAGGYILSAVIAFLLGVAVALLCTRQKKTAPPARKGDSDDDSEVTP